MSAKRYHVMFGFNVQWQLKKYCLNVILRIGHVHWIHYEIKSNMTKIYIEYVIDYKYIFCVTIFVS